MIDMQSMRIDVTVSQMDELQFGVVITDLSGQKHTTQFVIGNLSLYKLPFKQIWDLVGEKAMHYLPQAIYKYVDKDAKEKPKQEQYGPWTAHYNTPMVSPNFTTETIAGPVFQSQSFPPPYPFPTKDSINVEVSNTIGVPMKSDKAFADEFDKVLNEYKMYKEAEKHATAVPKVQKTTHKSALYKLFHTDSG